MPIQISGLSKDDLRPEQRPIRVAYKQDGDVEEREVRKLSAAEEEEMLLAGLDQIEYSGRPDTAVGRHMASMGVPEFLTANNDGFVDGSGMPQRRSTAAPGPKSVFEAVAMNDENFKEHQDTFIGDGFGGGDKGNEDPLEDKDQGMSIISETRAVTRRQRRTADPLETFVSSPVEDIHSKEHDTQHQFQERDDHGVYDRDINQNGEDPNAVVPEHYNEEGSWPMPGETQDFTAEPVKDIDIMAGVKVTLTDGRAIVGRIVSEDQLNVNIRGRLAGMQSDVNFPVSKMKIANVEKIRIRPKATQAGNLEDVYAAIKTKTAGEKKMETKAKVRRMPSGRYMDTNGNSYDSYEEAVGAENTNQGEDTDPDAASDAGNDVRRLPSGRFKDLNGNSYATYEEADEANKANYASWRGAMKRKAESKDAKDGSQARVDNSRGPGMLFGDDSALYDQLDKRTKALAAQASEIKKLIAIADKLDAAGQEVNAAKADTEIQRRHAVYKKDEQIVANLKKLIATRRASRRTASTRPSPIGPAVTADPDNKNPFMSKYL